MRRCWACLADAAALDLNTPLLAIDGDAVAVVASAVACRHADAGLRWCPATFWGSIPPVTDALRISGATGITVSRISEAEAAVAAGADAVTVVIPPVVGRQPDQFAELCLTASGTVVCDHFAQIERIAEACRRAGVEAEVLLRVDVGLRRLGVRPGPDLTDLAQGVANLRGLRAAGIWIGGLSAASGVGRLKEGELSRLIGRCIASIRRARIEAARISADHLQDLPAGTCGVTETRTPIVRENDGAAAVVAGVIGRPTRDQAVIDAGRDCLGETAAILWPRGDVNVAFIGDDFAVLHLASDQQDLAIGDVVALLPARPVRPMTGGQVLVRRQGAWCRGRIG